MERYEEQRMETSRDSLLGESVLMLSKPAVAHRIMQNGLPLSKLKNLSASESAVRDGKSVSVNIGEMERCRNHSLLLLFRRLENLKGT